MTTVEFLREQLKEIEEQMKGLDKASDMYADLLEIHNRVRSQIAQEEKAEIDLEFRNRQEEMEMRKIELDERKEKNKEIEANRPFFARPETRLALISALTTLCLGGMTLHAEEFKVITSKAFGLLPKPRFKW